MKKICIIIISLAMACGLATSAGATLIDRGNGLVYDDFLNITWMQDANYAHTSGYDDDGIMTWYGAMDWADQLSYGGYDDWRLPTAYTSDGSIVSGYYGPDTEMGHLRHIDMGVPYDEPVWLYSNENMDLFTNFNHYFWTSTLDVINNDLYGFYYDFGSFGEYWDTSLLDQPFSAWAVRDGDSISGVPEPSTLLLLGAGLLGLSAIRKKFKK